MSSMDSLILAGGAGLAAAVAVGLGVTLAGNKAAEAHPDGSEADDGLRTATWVGNGLGIAAAVGGFAAAVSGHQELGTLLLGAGVGAFLGSGIARKGFEGRHGVGVETAVQDMLATYDDNDDDRIDLYADSFWRGTETSRTVTHQSTDSNGYTTYYDEDVYSIERLVSLANGDRDQFATRQELRDVIASYDVDGNGRLQQAEHDRYEGEAGEQQLR